MIIVQEKLISDSVVQEHFMCNLNACKGACCWEGDFGAPLEENEIELLKKEYDSIKPYLKDEGIKAIAEKGLFTFYEEYKENGTTLLKNGACAYLSFDGPIAKCGIEKAYESGDSTLKKPISCHLYPIRVTEKEEQGFEALNYDEWDICSAACSLGKKEKIRVYEFVKSAIVRKYGLDFYEELDAAARYVNKENP